MATIETYLPLYRKYRPQSFADVMGQEAIRQTLGNALTQGKVAHAYLFCGPRGTGKTSSARIFAKSLNCEQGPTITPCQTCASCTGITAGNALDVIEFDAASNNKVDDARELIENSQFTPMAGRYKIYIIDEVHMLTSQAFNALLKTLEEPPPNVVFIFATTEAHKVLPTIVSRCQRFDFSRITRQDIIKRLAYIAEQEGIQIDAEALDTIARHVRGGMRDAVGLLDQVAVIGRAQPDKVITRDDVTLFIGALEEDILIGLSQAVAQRQADILLENIGELERRGIEPPQIVKELTAHYRHLFFVSSAKAAGRDSVTAEQLDLPEAYFQKLVEQAPLYALEELPQILNRLSSIERNIRNTQQPQLWLEVGLLELAHRHEIQVIQNLAERIESLEQALAGGKALNQTPVPVATQRPAAPQQPLPQPRPQIQAPPVQPVQQAPMPKAPVMQESSPAMAPPVVPMTPPAAQAPAMPERPAAPPPPVRPPIPPSEPVPMTGPQATYQQICQNVASSTTRDLLVQQTFALSLDGANITIGCNSEPILEIVKNPRKFIHLQKAADKVLGQPANIQLVLEKNMPQAVGAGAPTVPKPNGAALPTAAPARSAMPAFDTSAQAAASEMMPKETVTAVGVMERPPVVEATLANPVAQMPSVETCQQTPPQFSATASMTQPQAVPTQPLQSSYSEPSSIAFGAVDDDAPPMDDDMPPWGDEETGADLPQASAASVYQSMALGPSSLPEGSIGKQMAESVTISDIEAQELREAKHYTVQILQGRLLD